MRLDVLIAGVGGQGTVLASRLLAASSIGAGFFARTSETIGMAQRGGCVVSHVRIGSEASSPIIPMGKADLLIGFEPSEAARCICRLKPMGRCVVNTRSIKPVTASLGGSACDMEEVFRYIKACCGETVFVDGYRLAEEAGSVKTLNVVLLGVAAAKGFLPLDSALIRREIAASVAPKYAELNARAFDIGFNYPEMPEQE